LLEEVDRILSFAPPDADVIVNDRADVALIAGAAGVHLGQTDLQPIHARRVLGDGKIIGFSTHNLGQALEAEGYPVNYVAVGPIFTTDSKKNPDPVIGLDGLAGICRAIRKPVVAIGGIKLANAREVLEAGATSVAVISDVLSAPDVGLRVRNWLDALT